MRIAIIGDFEKKRPSHVATVEALKHAAHYLSKKVVIEWLGTKIFEDSGALARLSAFDAIWGAPGDHESSQGFINAIQVARERDTPYLGT